MIDHGRHERRRVAPLTAAHAVIIPTHVLDRVMLRREDPRRRGTVWLAVELALHGDGRADPVVERCAIGTRALVRPPEIDRCAIRRSDPRAARVAALEQAVANGEHAGRLHAIELDIDAAGSIEMRPHDLTMIELEANDGVGAVARQELVSAVGARLRLVRGVVDFLDGDPGERLATGIRHAPAERALARRRERHARVIVHRLRNVRGCGATDREEPDPLNQDGG